MAAAARRSKLPAPPLAAPPESVTLLARASRLLRFKLGAGRTRSHFSYYERARKRRAQRGVGPS
eukprot:6848415-Prymnesium_polylepis.1